VKCEMAGMEPTVFICLKLVPLCASGSGFGSSPLSAQTSMPGARLHVNVSPDRADGFCKPIATWKSLLFVRICINFSVQRVHLKPAAPTRARYMSDREV
jgi:hypothetical protein